LVSLIDNLKELRVLDIGDNNFRSYNDINLSLLNNFATVLTRLPMLETLNLSSCQLTDSSAKILASHLPNCQNLRQLNLKDNNLNDEAIGELARFLPQCKNLEMLDLSDTNFGDFFFSRASIISLAGILLECPNLQRIDISNSLKIDPNDTCIKDLSRKVELVNCVRSIIAKKDSTTMKPLEIMGLNLSKFSEIETNSIKEDAEAITKEMISKRTEIPNKVVDRAQAESFKRPSKNHDEYCSIT
jgi:Ran GTPase-activating protein (RanGAP) involved in mRNA processing and transport